MPDLYEIIKVPDPILKEKASVIENINPDIQSQAEKMVNTMYEGLGIGLAANQIGKLNRMFVMDVPEGAWVHGPIVDGIQTIEAGYRSGERDLQLNKNPKILINPEVIWASEQKSVYEEGCLSIPQQYGEVIRPAQVKVRYQDLSGKTHEEDFDGLDSHCAQHEIDHLDGVLFIDYLSSLKRNMILRKMKKLQKDSGVL